MQIYLLATNLFALAALLLGFGSFSGGRRSWRLLPLFLLVIARSLSLIISLIALNPDQAAPLLGVLEVFSAFCMVWTLTDFTSNWPRPWPQLAWVSAAAAILLTFLPLWPNWPVPIELHSLTIAVFSAPLILMSAGEIRWSHLATPLGLALANFLSLLDLNGPAWLISLLAY
ncbi:MAG TPA: hypothetical protein VEC96_02975, partial [Anaerolineae bacterium]|nr:hypothetical protein [Anaerolineae bacterium]